MMKENYEACAVAIIGVPKLLEPYDTFEWAVVSSLFLVHALGPRASNVSAWLGKK
jgi:hypothetical protein